MKNQNGACNGEAEGQETVEILEEQESGLRAVDVGSRISTPSSSPFQTQRCVCVITSYLSSG